MLGSTRLSTVIFARTYLDLIKQTCLIPLPVCTSHLFHFPENSSISRGNFFLKIFSMREKYKYDNKGGFGPWNLIEIRGWKGVENGVSGWSSRLDSPHWFWIRLGRIESRSIIQSHLISFERVVHPKSIGRMTIIHRESSTDVGRKIGTFVSGIYIYIYTSRLYRDLERKC